MSAANDQRLIHCALCEDPHFLYRDCVLAVATAMRNACVEKVRALRREKALDWYGNDATEGQVASFMITPDEIIAAFESLALPAPTTKAEGQ